MTPPSFRVPSTVPLSLYNTESKIEHVGLQEKVRINVYNTFEDRPRPKEKEILDRLLACWVPEHKEIGHLAALDRLTRHLCEQISWGQAACASTTPEASAFALKECKRLGMPPGALQHIATGWGSSLPNLPALIREKEITAWGTKDADMSAETRLFLLETLSRPFQHMRLKQFPDRDAGLLLTRMAANGFNPWETCPTYGDRRMPTQMNFIEALLQRGCPWHMVSDSLPPLLATAAPSHTEAERVCGGLAYLALLHQTESPSPLPSRERDAIRTILETLNACRADPTDPFNLSYKVLETWASYGQTWRETQTPLLRISVLSLSRLRFQDTLSSPNAEDAVAFSPHWIHEDLPRADVKNPDAIALHALTDRAFHQILWHGKKANTSSRKAECRSLLQVFQEWGPHLWMAPPSPPKRRASKKSAQAQAQEDDAAPRASRALVYTPTPLSCLEKHTVCDAQSYSLWWCDQISAFLQERARKQKEDRSARSIPLEEHVAALKANMPCVQKAPEDYVPELLSWLKETMAPRYQSAPYHQNDIREAVSTLSARCSTLLSLVEGLVDVPHQDAYRVWAEEVRHSCTLLEVRAKEKSLTKENWKEVLLLTFGALPTTLTPLPAPSRVRL